MRKIAVGATFLTTVTVLTGYIGVGVVRREVAPNGSNYLVTAKQGADDGGGTLFRAAVVCSGENFWRYGDWQNVANVAPETILESRAWCPAGRVVVGATVERSRS